MEGARGRAGSKAWTKMCRGWRGDCTELLRAEIQQWGVKTEKALIVGVRVAYVYMDRSNMRSRCGLRRLVIIDFHEGQETMEDMYRDTSFIF
jgi:hypothetical protein